MYVVIEFPLSNEVAVIPTEWMVGKNCALWPPYDSGKARLACINKEWPGANRQSFAVKICTEAVRTCVFLRPYDALCHLKYEIFNDYYIILRDICIYYALL